MLNSRNAHVGTSLFLLSIFCSIVYFILIRFINANSFAICSLKFEGFYNFQIIFPGNFQNTRWISNYVFAKDVMYFKYSSISKPFVVSESKFETDYLGKYGIAYHPRLRNSPIRNPYRKMFLPPQPRFFICSPMPSRRGIRCNHCCLLCIKSKTDSNQCPFIEIVRKVVVCVSASD